MNYAEYIAKSLVSNIEYSEYISENLVSNIDYTKYIAENLGTNLNYAEYIAESLGNYGKSKKQVLKETRIAKLEKLNKIND